MSDVIVISEPPDAVLERAVPAARALAQFAGNVFEHGAPEAVSRYTVELILDQLGLQLGCATLPWSEAVHGYMTEFAPSGQASIFYHGTKVHPEHAAFVNAAFGHGQDYDDTCHVVQTHPGAVVIPVALAVGEQVGATGTQVLRATIAGLEVMLRAAHSVSPDCLKRGHHTPPASGPFGAAVAAGLLMGLSEDQLVQAMAIAGSFSGGLIEYTQSGGSVKRIHTAIPTTSGIRAAGFAKRGLTGPETVLDGVKGFTRVFSNGGHVERLTSGLGVDYLIQQVALKAYNCCYFIHAPMEAFRDIVQENGLKPDDIKRVDVGTSAHGAVHVGSIQHPTDPLGGQFSVHFSLAMALMDELPGLVSYTDEQLNDPRLQEFCDRVHVYTDAVADAEYPASWGGIVHVTDTLGRTYERRVRYAKGTPVNPMTAGEVADKFRRNVAGVLKPETAERVLTTLAGIDGLTAISDLTALLVADAR